MQLKIIQILLQKKLTITLNQKIFFHLFTYFKMHQQFIKKDWINIYNYFVDKKDLIKIWPRGLPLEEITKSKDKIIVKKNKKIQ